ncbi:P-loop containing nucleoside triphosphate hydrolase protein [Sporodiniella umbellata]|nr:P-loop containing nucleoside triphosphate hydrolase protein [Sporodiniella umbellata]
MPPYLNRQFSEKNNLRNEPYKQQRNNASLLKEPLRQKPEKKVAKTKTAKSITTQKIERASHVESQGPAIQVFIRKAITDRRRVLGKEKSTVLLSENRAISFSESKKSLGAGSHTEESSFVFDKVFDSSITEKSVYLDTVKPLVEHTFKGGKSICFAFEQTESGKLCSMSNSKCCLYTQATKDLFCLLKKKEYLGFSAWISYYEVYEHYINDLLGNKKRQISKSNEKGKESLIIPGLKELRLNDIDTWLNVHNYRKKTEKKIGNQKTLMCYAVLQICLKNRGQKYGKIGFIDFFGNGKRNQDKNTSQKSFETNCGMLILKEYFRVLSQYKEQKPFGGSTLSMSLHSTFIGNSKTCIIATVPPNALNDNHMLNTLRRIYRIKEFKSSSNIGGKQSSISIKKSRSENSGSMHSMIDLEETAQNKQLPKITKKHIKKILKNHWTEIRENQLYISAAKKLLSDVNEAHNELQYFNPKYQVYLERLKELLKQKIDRAKAFQREIRDDLCSDDESNE